VTVAVDIERAVTVKSGSVPLRATICGLPVALSITEREALRGPRPVGAKVTLIWQLAPAASEGADAHVLVWLKSPAFVPAMEMPEIVSAAGPALVSSTDCGELVVPVACGPNVREFGAKLAAVAPIAVATTSVIVFVWERDDEVPVMLTG
jgi:hypothetical protein